MNRPVLYLDAGARVRAAPAAAWNRWQVFDDWLTIAFVAAYLVMLSSALYLFFGQLDNGYISAKAGASTSYELLWFALYAALLFGLRDALMKPVHLVVSHPLFVLFVLSSVTTYLLSPPADLATAEKLGMYVTTMLFGLFLSRRIAMERFFNIFIVVAAGILIVHWAVFPGLRYEIHYDSIGRTTVFGTHAYGGLFSHKNSAGSFFGFSFLACYSRLLSPRCPRRWLIGTLALADLFTILMAGAAGAFLGVAAAAFVITAVQLLAHRSKLAPFFFVFAALAVLAMLSVGEATLLGAMGRDEGMSGRWRLFEVWPEYFWQHPLFGWGYGNFFNDAWDAPAVNLQRLTTYHAEYYTFESAYLQFCIDFGIVGALLFFGMFAAGIFGAARLAWLVPSPYAATPLAWLLFLAAMSVSDSSVCIHNVLEPAIVAWSYFGIASRMLPQARAAPIAARGAHRITPPATSQAMRSTWTHS